ncbi:hypothetical protein JCM19233_6614 [Vibrio astriarenae]|nr:hypothetical protein JCM19233_6614 [Vibrio sp. C7]
MTPSASVNLGQHRRHYRDEQWDGIERINNKDVPDLKVPLDWPQ